MGRKSRLYRAHARNIQDNKTGESIGPKNCNDDMGQRRLLLPRFADLFDDVQNHDIESQHLADDFYAVVFLTGFDGKTEASHQVQHAAVIFQHSTFHGSQPFGACGIQ